MRVYKCGCAASLEWCQNTKSHADMKNSWREMLLQWAYQKSHYHHVQCVYCKIWIFIMLLGRRYFELYYTTQWRRECFSSVSHHLNSIWENVSPQTHTRRVSERDRVVYVLIQVLFCITQYLFDNDNDDDDESISIFFFSSSECTHASTIEGSS